MSFKNENVQNTFSITEQTVRNWADSFAKYLSPGANPGSGATRLFTREDMAVFSLIAEMRGQGKKYDAIGLALENGQRGGLPDLPDEALIELSSSAHGIMLANENRELKAKIMTMATDIESFSKMTTENIQLKERLVQRDEIIDDLKKRMVELEDKLIANIERKGREYTLGVMETLQRLGKLPGKDADKKPE